MNSFTVMKTLLVRAFNAGVAAVNPYERVVEALRVSPSALVVSSPSSPNSLSIPLSGRSSIYLIAFGKASGTMAAAAEKVLGDRMKGGIVIVPEAKNVILRSKVMEGGRNNLPDEGSLAATKQVLEMIDTANSEAVFVILISGGGSALLSLPHPSISLEDKLNTIKALVSRGATIQQLNAVRRELSQVKGGGLARRIGGRKAVVLVLSDIIGDPVEFIASGPAFVLQDSSVLTAHDVIDALNANDVIPLSVLNLLNQQQTLRGNPSIPSIPHFVVCNNQRALDGMKSVLQEEGYRVEVVSSSVSGDANEFGRRIADLLASSSPKELFDGVLPFRNVAVNDQFTSPSPPTKIALLFGGETTVKVGKDSGLGGRCQEAALAAFHQLLSKPRSDGASFGLLMGGSDGQDGPTDAAGVVFDHSDVDMYHTQGVLLTKASESLSRHDSFHFWSSFRDGHCHLQSGLTGTNVMDLTALLINF